MRAVSVAGLLLVAGPLAGCGLVAQGAGSGESAAGSTQSPHPGMPSGTASASSTPPTPAPSPTPGKGPRCPVLRCASVVVTGGMPVHSSIWQEAQQDAAEAGKPGLDFLPMLEGQRRYLERSDLAICHQGSPVAKSDGPFAGHPSFNVPPQIVTAAKDVGYQACTTAGDHILDRSTDGLLRTVDALDAAGLKHTGSYRTATESQQILILQTPAAKVAVIEATFGLNGKSPEYPWQVDVLDSSTMIAKARKARMLGADVVIGAMHAGDGNGGNTGTPTAQQTDAARALADSGQFNLVYGHSPSVLPIENYKGTWIAYGLGNGMTDVSPAHPAKSEGLLVRAQFGQDAAGTWTVTDLAWTPTVMAGNPYRWCSVAADAPQGPCAGAPADDATRQRTIGVVNSMGAATAGAHELLITLEP
ncbi:CapA family protein [Pseudarthrobacter equi]|uniref:CapA family protein n=1 Tax=Pseudarthrobacter equi TaxID=728066 RepID=UPI0028D7BF05|nr:CapA family protein [Pseudarthrobacter equi]